MLEILNYIKVDFINNFYYIRNAYVKSIVKRGSM